LSRENILGGHSRTATLDVTGRYDISIEPKRVRAWPQM
jgi:hypothetical protein